MSVSASPTSATQNGNGIQDSRNFLATVTGGTGPYTYLWSQVGGDVMAITSPTLDLTAFQANVNPTDYLSGTFQCQATDSMSNVATSNQITAFFQGVT